jgi:cyanophycinase
VDARQKSACLRRASRWVLAVYLLAAWYHASPADESGPAQVGPERGALLIHGGGKLSRPILKRFIELAGGPDALILVIPTAGEDSQYDDQWRGLRPLREAGATNLRILHTRDRDEADSSTFIEPIERAGGVWIAGGRQWRLADAYLGTRTERALRGVLDRGGVIGGASAGASIMGSYLVRGAPEGFHVMMSPGHEQGFGYMRNTAIDQHLLTRQRQDDMLAVVQRHPELLGIGLDEEAAVIVQGDRLEVIGQRQIAIYDPQMLPAADGERYYFLQPGDRFDLKTRRRE